MTKYIEHINKKIIPQEVYKIVSPLSIEEIKARIIVFFQKKEYIVSWKDIGHFENSSLNTFQVSQSQPYRLFGYKAVIYGELYNKKQNETEIQISIEMEKKSKVFFLIWVYLMGMVAFVCLPIVIVEFINNESEIWSMVPIVMFVIGYGTISLKFKKDSKKIKESIFKILHGE